MFSCLAVEFTDGRKGWSQLQIVRRLQRVKDVLKESANKRFTWDSNNPFAALIVGPNAEPNTLVIGIHQALRPDRRPMRVPRQIVQHLSGGPAIGVLA